jgi:general secretion pathway protein E
MVNTGQRLDIQGICEGLKNGTLMLESTKGKFAVPADLDRKVCYLSDGSVIVASSYKSDPLFLDYLNTLTRGGLEYEITPADLTDIERILNTAANTAQRDEDDAERQKQMVNLIERATSQKASDLHLVVYEKVCHIMIRVDGDMIKLQQLSAPDGISLMRCAYQTMCDTADETLRDNEAQDGSLKSSFVQRLGLFGARLATRPLARGKLMVMRLLYDTSSSGEGLESLNYPPELAEAIRRFTHLSHGIVIFSGPTGSGKSMAMQRSLENMIRYFENRLHVLTIENPPEYRIEGANQTPLSHHGSWAADIKNSMRLDPDVMMIGEIRDLDSALAGFRAAMTGHGIWTTLHTNDSTSVVDRLFDLGVEKSLLLDPSLLRGIVSQNLVQHLCPHCSTGIDKAEISIPDDMRERLDRYVDLKAVRFRHKDGCARCKHRGIIGRLPVAEVLQPNHSFFETYINEGKAAARRFWLEKMGGVSKTQHLIRLINQGKVDPFEGEKSVGPIDDDYRTIGYVAEPLPASSRPASRVEIA